MPILSQRQPSLIHRNMSETTSISEHGTAGNRIVGVGRQPNDRDITAKPFKILLVPPSVSKDPFYKLSFLLYILYPTQSYREREIQSTLQAYHSILITSIFPSLSIAIMSFGLPFTVISRFLVGGSSLLSPSFTANFVSYPYESSATSMSYRLFGIREFVLGGSLWFASSNSPELLQPVLIAGSIIDAVDILSTGICVLQEGNLDSWALTLSAGGAALLLAIQLWTLSGLRRNGGRKVQ